MRLRKPRASSDDVDVAYCESYCDEQGFYQPPRWCMSEDVTVSVFCCGTSTHRYCCTNPDEEVIDNVGVGSCPQSTWLLNQ